VKLRATELAGLFHLSLIKKEHSVSKIGYLLGTLYCIKYETWKNSRNGVFLSESRGPFPRHMSRREDQIKLNIL